VGVLGIVAAGGGALGGFVARGADELAHLQRHQARVALAILVECSAGGARLRRPSTWLDPATNGENVAWTRETHAALAGHLTERRWLNYLGDDQGEDAIRAAYGPNYDRLVGVKRRVDPENVFRHNHNIAP